MKKILSLLLLVICLAPALQSQNNNILLDKIFKDKMECYFSTTIPNRDAIHELTRIVSIDNVSGLTVYAYANRSQFSRFLRTGYKYTLLPNPGSLIKEEELNMRGVQDKSPLTTWNFYPTYDEYINEMNTFAATYPDICKIVTIGTTLQDRQIIAVKISDSVNFDQGEPEVFLTSSIHGDETTGYVLMLHLIDSLLTGYNQNPRITNLVNNFQILINPLANPDGTYHGGNTSVAGAQRGNANGIDLNRNFPDPKGGQHPDQNPWQKETEAFMHFDTINHFVMSMNFHGGEEVFNYPWDTWVKLHADNDWFDHVGREYADTVHLYGPPSYFIGPNYSGNGVTNGNAWYEVEGGRQDYTTYFHNGREVTLEISVTKTPPANQLVNFWNYNCRSFLNYIEESGFGINGIITDSVTNLPLHAKVMILGHDKDNSYVYSNLPSGWYFRPINAGTYALNISAPDYYSKTITGITTTNRNITRLNVKLVPLSIGFVEEIDHSKVLIYPNPTDGNARLMFPESNKGSFTLEIFNSMGQLVVSQQYNETVDHILPLDLTQLGNGLYVVKLKGEKKIYENRLIVVR